MNHDIDLADDERTLLQGFIAHDLAHLLAIHDADDPNVMELFELYVRTGNKLGMHL